VKKKAVLAHAIRQPASENSSEGRRKKLQHYKNYAMLKIFTLKYEEKWNNEIF